MTEKPTDMPALTPQHRADIMARIDRARRATRNGDVLYLCDTVAKLLERVGSTASNSVGSTARQGDSVGATANVLPYCPQCAAAKERKRVAMARYRERKGNGKPARKPARKPAERKAA